jgi:hypothetical protein
MSTLAANYLTLADLTKRLDPDGKIGDIGEMLSQTNEVLLDAPFVESNLLTGHQVNIRTGLPDVYWRQINVGVPTSKSRTAQVMEACARLEAWSEVDEALAELNGNSAAFRLSEASAFIEAMNQKMADTIFYGDASTTPEQFTGLTTRYSSTTAVNGQNIVDCGANSGDGNSAWLICWSPQTVFMTYPKGTKGGLEHNDLGLQTVHTSTTLGGARLRAYQDQFIWRCGMVVKDWRYAVRIANIDTSVIIADPTGATLSLINNMIKAIHRLPNMNMGRPVFYVNRTVREMLDIQAMQKSNVYLNVGEEEGRPKTVFRGIPVRTVDALTSAEADVT